ncbi:MAG: transglycosylase domain-containing protein [Methylococcales bacterium]|nr:transglycosylase domain-containing protein [Methylococcales bacterium]
MRRRQVPRGKSSAGKFVRYLTLYIVLVSIVVCFVVVKLVRDEVKTSKYQARYLSSISEQLGFKLASGPSSTIRYPEYGPYDQRLGYTLLPEVIKRLENAGFVITSQAAFSPMMSELADYGLFNIYHEKTQAGLRITDKDDQVFFNAIYPAYGYPSFKSVPPLIMDTLLFIENRELLSEQHTTVNPAIEWDRLGFAGLQLMAHKLGATHALPGGSTLATQMEKYRHSKNGYTNSILDKFRQMGTASLRAYMMGPDTLEMRQEIALSYLNSMPLAATPKLGEIHGLGDGLSGWFGSDFAEVNKLLSPEALKPPRRISEQQAIAYRQVLNIFLSQRRPSYLLGRGYDALQNLTDSYLRVMTEQGIVSPALRDAALQVTTVRPLKVDSVPVQYFTQKKTQNVLRARLAKTLGVKSNYDLDRLDLTVKTTLDYDTQQAVTSALKLLSQPEEARAAGVLGFRMLNENTDLTPIVYSLMLFERSETGNLLRIQTDNYDQPLDINEGIRLDLGSTSKLRTMVHYLELVTDVYEQYKELSPQALSKIDLHPRDYISAWVIEQLKHSPKIKLEDLLNLALDKRYSAGPGEYFFTGGGLHHFNNFTEDENNKIMSVRDALRDSVNLVFIRLMREVVYHHLYKPDGIARWLESPDNPKRKEYLQRFADNEGQVYLNRFYTRYKGKSADAALETLTKRVIAKPSRFTMLYRSIYPENDEMALNAFLNTHLGKAVMAKEDIYELYDKYSIEKFDLQDQGYITKIHPLELWLVGYLAQHPHATRKEVVAASFEQRQDVYRWLFKNHRKFAQQQRIMTLLEEEAFKSIHNAWTRVGYPFEALTPSYATAIGASGDRPAALAELTGILLNDGIRLPVVRFESLHYAQGTPYETIMKKAPTKGERIFAPDIAKVARGALVGVVEGGTAGRLNGVYTDDKGSRLSVGGKTGTGDHRKQIWGAGGSLIESKFISRAATFTFFIGDRFFGVITAYVEGENSGLYHFTSSLPVQIVKFLKPTLSPLINNTSPVKEVTPPIVKVLMVENSKPAAKTEAVKLTKPLIEKPVVKVVKPQIENAVVKTPRPLIEKPAVKIAQPLVEKALVQISKPSIDKLAVKAAKPLIEKPVIKVIQPKIDKPMVNDINPLATQTTVKVINPTIKAIEPKTTKVSGNQKITTTDRNDSATRYYKYPTTPALTQ